MGVSWQRIFKSLQKGKHASKLQVEDFQSCAKMEASKQAPGGGFSKLCKHGSKQASGGGVFKAVQKWKQASRALGGGFFKRCAKMEASKQAPGNCAIVCMQCTDQRGTNSHSCCRRSGKSTVECQGFRP